MEDELINVILTKLQDILKSLEPKGEEQPPKIAYVIGGVDDNYKLTSEAILKLSKPYPEIKSQIKIINERIGRYFDEVVMSYFIDGNKVDIYWSAGPLYGRGLTYDVINGELTNEVVKCVS